MTDAMKQISMKLVRPARNGDHFVARWREPGSRLWRQHSTSEQQPVPAVLFAQQLAARIVRDSLSSPMGFAEFVLAYAGQGIAHLSRDYAAAWRTVARSVTDLVDPLSVADLTPLMVGRWQAELGRRVAPASVASYGRTLRAALRWAADMEILESAPKFRIPAVKKCGGRPLTDAEVESILLSAADVRPNDSQRWIRLMRGMLYSGLRLSEIRSLSWDACSPRHLDGAAVPPRICLAGSAQKRRVASVEAILPEFWAVCTAPGGRQGLGWVFPVPGRRGRQMAAEAMSRVVSAIGAAAGVITDPDTGGHATAHDWRRTFGRVLIEKGFGLDQVQLMLRHADIATTMNHYRPRGATELVEALWA